MPPLLVMQYSRRLLEQRAHKDALYCLHEDSQLETEQIRSPEARCIHHLPRLKNELFS